MGEGMCGEWVRECVESGRGSVWRVGEGVCGEWARECVEEVAFVHGVWVRYGIVPLCG